jgi:UDPglucose 6-dehydrogenase
VNFVWSGTYVSAPWAYAKVKGTASEAIDRGSAAGAIVNICMIGADKGAGLSSLLRGIWLTVTCVDKDADRIARLRRGEVPIYEPGLDALVERNANAGRIHFSTTLSPAVQEAEVVFLAVGTPMRRGDGYADLTYIFEAVDEMAPHLNVRTIS